MNLSLPELIYLQAKLSGGVSLRPGASDFTAEDALKLDAKLAAEIKARKAVIPENWRQAASEYAAENGIQQFTGQTEADRRRKALEEISKRRQAIETRAHWEKISPEDALAELGL